MCLAVPSKIVKIDGDNAVVEIDGIRRTVNISLVRNVQTGDYVLLHAGFAIQKWSEEDVREYREIMKEMVSQDFGVEDK